MQKKKILGLDLGVSSIWWAIIETDENEEHSELIPWATGVRIFSQVTTEKDDKKMKNADRRSSRMMRRNISRRARRVAHVLHTLVDNNLLPKVTLEKENNLSFQEKYWNHINTANLLKKNPLELRAKWTTEKLELYEFGRALYHICQKRGFQSTSKKELKDLKLLEASDEWFSWKLRVDPQDLEKIMKKIEDNKELDFKEKRLYLQHKVWTESLGKYTYEEVFKKWESIKDLGTNRYMYRHEFDVLWSSQSKYHSELTEKLKTDLKKIIFEQRPLKSQEDLIWSCKYFPDQKRIAKSHPLAQEFLILWYLNNLTVFTDGTKKKTNNMAEIFGDTLETKIQEWINIFRTTQDIKKKKISEWLGVDERLINSNKAAWKWDILYIKLSKILTEYTNWGSDKQNNLIRALTDEDIERTHKTYTLLWIDEKYWSELDTIDDKDIPSKYLALSQTAIELFLPEFRKWIPFKTIEKDLQEKIDPKGDTILPKEYHNKYQKISLSRQKKTSKNHLPNIANPRVTKTLVELRKILRAITQKYWSIDEVRIETSRDLKNGPKKRWDIERTQREKEKNNEILQKELKEFGRNTDIHSDDFKKYKLWKELWINHISPYHYKWRPTENIIINEHNLFDNAEIQIEHILPLSWSLDDSFNNKTLCPREINLDKGNKTPFEYYNWPDSADWKSFEQKVWNIFWYKDKDWNKKVRRKGRQLLMTPDEVREVQGKFATQDLNDTAYIAVEAKEFCQALLGEATHEQSLVQTSKWQLTSVLRWNWRWNELLNPNESDLEKKNMKNRWDHRHHAIDAVIIALTSQKIMKRASDLAKKLDENKFEVKLHERVWGKIVPWIDGITLTLQKNIDEMNISHANSKKVSGALHKETNYGTRNIQVWTTQNTIVTSRIDINIFADLVKKLPEWDERVEKAHALTGNIIDRLIREDLFEKISNNTFTLPYLHPDTWTPIKKMRKIDESLTVDGLMSFGKWLFKNDDNHHIEILECIEEWKNKGKKVGIVVQLSETYERKKNHRPIYNRVWPWIDGEDIYNLDKNIFLFSLTKWELVQRENWKIYQFTGVKKSKQMTLYEQYASGDSKAKKPFLIEPNPNTLHAEKIQIDALGDIRPAND